MSNIKKVPVIDVNTGKIMKQWKMKQRGQKLEAVFKEKIDAEAFVKMLKEEEYAKGLKIERLPHPDGGYMYEVSGYTVDFDRNMYWCFNADALAYGGSVP